MTTLPIRFVINTHYHLDHTGGNAVFVNAGAVAVAHQNVRTCLVSEARARGQSGDALADAVMPALAEKYGNWEAFKYLARPDILDTDAELSGEKRIP